MFTGLWNYLNIQHIAANYCWVVCRAFIAVVALGSPSPVLAEVPDNLQTCRQLAGFLSRAGGVADEEIDLTLAERSCKAASVADPLDFEAVAYLSRIHWVRSKREASPAEREEAESLARLSAEQWQPEGLLMLGVIADADGEREKAIDWHLRAAERGSFTACMRVATAYADGVGIDEDLVEAGRWLASCRPSATVEQRQTIDSAAMQAVQKLLIDNSEKIKDSSYVGTQANARGLMRIVDFNEAFYGTRHIFSTDARAAMENVLQLMHEGDRALALNEAVMDGLDAAGNLSRRGAFFAAADRAGHASVLAKQISRELQDGDFDPMQAVETALQSIWLDAIPDVRTELSEADLFDKIIPYQRLKDAKKLTRILAPYANAMIDADDLAISLQKVEARWTAMHGDVDRAASLYEEAYRREAARTGGGGETPEAPQSPAVPAVSDHRLQDWFRSNLLAAANTVTDETMEPQARLMALRAGFLGQDRAMLVEAYSKSFVTLEAEQTLDYLFGPLFEDGGAFEPDMRDPSRIFESIAAKEFASARDWEAASFPILSDVSLAPAERLARVAQIIEQAGGSPFPIEDNIRTLLDLHAAGNASDPRIAEVAVNLMNTAKLMTPYIWAARLGEAVLAIHSQLGPLAAFRQALGAAKYSLALDGVNLLFDEYMAAGEDRGALQTVAGRATFLRDYILSDPPAWSDANSKATNVADDILKLTAERARSRHSLAIYKILDLHSLGAVTVEELPALLALRNFFAEHFGTDNDLFVHQALERIRARAKVNLEIAVLSAMRSFTNFNLASTASFAAQARALATIAFEEDDPALELVANWQASMPGIRIAEKPFDPTVRAAFEETRAISAAVRKVIDATPPAGLDLLAEPGADDEDSPDTSRPLERLALDAIARVDAIRRIGSSTLRQETLSAIGFMIDEFRSGAYPSVARDLAEAMADYYRQRPDAVFDAAFMDRNAAQAAELAGDFDGAFASYERAVGALTEAKMSDAPLLQALLLDMASLYAQTGRPDVADSVLKSFPDILPIVSKPGLAFPTAALDSAIASLQASTKQFSLVVWASTLGPTANTISGLALSDGRLPVALAWAAALDVAHATDQMNEWDVDATFLRARIYLAENRDAEAVGLLRTLVEKLVPSKQVAPLVTASARLALARAQMQSGDLPGASLSVKDALSDIAIMDIGDNPVLAAFHWEAGRIASADGRLSDAVASHREAVRRARDPATGFLRRAVWDPGWADRFTPQRALDALLDSLWQMGGAEGEEAIAEQAFEASQLSALAEAASAISESALRNSATDPQLRVLLRERQNAQRQLKSLHDTLADDIAGASQIVGTRSPERLRARIAELDALIAALSPDFAATLNPRATTPDELRRLLAEGEVALKVQSGEGVTHVFVVNRDRLVWKRIAVSKDSLQADVTKLRRALDPASMSLRGARPMKEIVENGFPFDTAFDLYDRIFREALESSGQVPNHVFYEASGPLETLPLQVLLRRPAPAETLRERLRNADWLARLTAITVVPSIGSISVSSSAAHTEARRPFFGIGAPEFAGASAPAQTAGLDAPANFGELFRGGAANLEAIAQLAPLPEARDELLAINASLGGDAGMVVTGLNATQGALFAKPLRDVRVLAFATHGLVAGDISQLAEPALALTPVNGGADDDGLLTMSEVAQLDLDADWVILSACNTASSDGRTGSGALSGLAQAFFYTGAQRLLVSNWPVNSQAAVRVTTQTMAAYSGAAAQPAAEALQSAIVEILDDPTSSTLELHPAYWGPFSLVSRRR